jgi:hypothetical protein
MFKKNAWIVGLLMGLAIMFVGCVDVFVDEDGEPTEVFNLQDYLADAPIGVIANDDAWTEIFGDSPFMMCGGPSNGEYSVISEKGVKKIKVDKMGPTWGVGFDLYNDKGANFKDGDEFYIKGKTSAGGLIANITTSGEKRLGDVDLAESGGDFEQTLTLAAGNAGSIRTGSPKALRIHYKNNNGSERKGFIIIEELTLNGKRKAGEGGPVVEPPLPPPPPLSTVYQVPVGSGNTFYMNLNDWETVGTAVNSTKVTGTLAASKITLGFVENGQRVNFKFDGTQLNKILDSPTNIKVTIAGSETGTGTARFRYHFGDPNAGGSWNATNTADTMDFDDLVAIGEKTLVWSGNFSASTAAYFIIQAQNPASGDFTGTTIEIESIKITVNPPAELDAIALTLAQPIAGIAAPTSLDGTGFTGAISWSPALTDKGKFKTSTVYYANVVISPKSGYTVKYPSPTTITVNDANAYYNPATKAVTTPNFARTDATAVSLGEGTLFSFAEWVVGKSSLQDPLVQSGGPTIAVSSAGVAVTGITNSWDGLDIALLKIDDQIDPALFKIKVVVKGKITALKDGETGGTVKLGGGDNPYTDVATMASDIAADTEFTLTCNEIPANYFTAHANANGRVVRITANQAKVTGFTITSITVSNEGDR